MKKLFLALPFLALSLIAQDFRGSLVGTVTDAGGGRVRNAVIVLRAGGSSLERQAASDGRGEFRFDDLSPGSYRVTVNAPGFDL